MISLSLFYQVGMRGQGSLRLAAECDREHNVPKYQWW